MFWDNFYEACLANNLGVSVDYLLGREVSEIPKIDPTTRILVEYFNKLSPKDKLDFLNMIIKRAG